MYQNESNPKRNHQTKATLYQSLNEYMDSLSLLPEEEIRRRLPEMRFPLGVDFSCEIGGTEYIVISHFNQDAPEAVFNKLARMLESEVAE